MNGFNRFIEEDLYSKPTRTFITHIICYCACLINRDISLPLKSKSRYTNSAHSEIMSHLCCLIKN